MKKYMILCTLLVALMGCNDGANSNAADDTRTNAAANDSMPAPDGVINSSPISTNPDATRTDTSKQADTTK